MGLKEYFSNKKTKEPVNYIGACAGVQVHEQFKGLVDLSPQGFNRDTEKHPYNFQETIAVYKKFAPAFGAIDKIVDFTVGPGFYVKTEDERAEMIISDFLQSNEFDTLLRAWLRDALITGNGFLEIGGSKNKIPEGLKILSPSDIYVKRDQLGNVLGYAQIKGIKEKVDFEPFEIAHLKHNVIADEPYGLGIIFPALDIIDKLLKCQKDMQTLIERKANSPYHIKVGKLDPNGDIVPPQSDIDSIAQRLSSMKANQEWVTDVYWDIKAIDFGNFGEKFQIPLRHYEDQLFFAFQVPEVLMGRGSIPEGLATVQMEAFQRRIQSLQAEIEKIIEQKIFRRVLDSNGFFNLHVEFEWGQPGNEDKRKELERLTLLLQNPMLNLELRNAIESRIAALLNLEVEEKLEAGIERELEEPQPKLPGQNREQLYEHLVNDNLSVYEWCNLNYIKESINQLGFTFIDYTDRIVNKINRYRFPKVTGKEKGDVKTMRKVLTNGFLKGASMKLMAQELTDKGFTQKDAFSIVRTETIRVSNDTSLDMYSEAEVNEVQFLATNDDRTDFTCNALDGQIFDVDEARGVIPDGTHPNCRCTFVPLITEKIRIKVKG